MAPHHNRRAGPLVVDQIEAALDTLRRRSRVEPTCEADVILVQAEDITAQVNNLTLDPGEPGNDLILLFADLAELAEDHCTTPTSKTKRTTLADSTSDARRV
jgi:hypothetical protein